MSMIMDTLQEQMFAQCDMDTADELVRNYGDENEFVGYLTDMCMESPRRAIDLLVGSYDIVELVYQYLINTIPDEGFGGGVNHYIKNISYKKLTTKDNITCIDHDLNIDNKFNDFIMSELDCEMCDTTSKRMSEYLRLNPNLNSRTLEWVLEQMGVTIED